MKKKRKVIAIFALMTCLLAVGVCSFALASDVPSVESITTTVSAQMETVRDNAMSMLATVTPIALTVIGAVLVIRMGVIWFQRMVGRSK